jgi:hypothetical protein
MLKVIGTRKSERTGADFEKDEELYSMVMVRIILPLRILL